MEPYRADLVVHRMYISSLRVAGHEPTLRRLNITHILTVCPMRPSHYEGITYKLVSISDSPDCRIDLKFGECFEFIRSALASGGTILIHCFQGISRSASVVIGYLIFYNNMDFTQAFNHLKSRRSMINPNFGFIKQLQSFALNPIIPK
jgi:dual specificity protein phosphatase 1B